MGNAGIPVVDSFRYLAKLIQYCKFKKKKIGVFSANYPILSSKFSGGSSKGWKKHNEAHFYMAM